MIVAIDGGAASGKSAVGRRVAAELGLAFVDSGLMYRAVAYLAVEGGIGLDDRDALLALAAGADLQVHNRRIWVGNRELTEVVYSPSIAEMLPRVSALAPVREVLVERQRALAGSGVVMAGRDIGTDVFPKADHKFFLVAGLAERIRRREEQFRKRGEATDPAALEREVTERDRIDSERDASPLRAAADAVVIETDSLTLAEVVEGILSRVRGSRVG
ncbi:MAG TPA: (d)CMP kinase [Candidatus Dormibacteraeota bacterium]|jgi:cytidylate kinase|nr:(d)CMP kinase [Candidatus Dormibacteraeota bacterium]